MPDFRGDAISEVLINGVASQPIWAKRLPDVFAA
jgi:hypothetical protein